MRYSLTNSNFDCKQAHQRFSAYLDGQLSGREMASIASHLETCSPCKREFGALRATQATLAQLGHVPAPASLQARLRDAIAIERERSTYLPFMQRWLQAWHKEIAPLALRATGGITLAVALVGGLSWIFAAPIAVEANDDNIAHLSAPRFLYSTVPPQPIASPNDAPILVDAHIDASGRVYDFSIVQGPSDDRINRQLTENLLGSIFKPAEAFGEPVRGHVMLTFSGISVRG